MTDLSKIKPTHTRRAAFIYVRQSTPSQVEHNRESTARQYALADRACQLGWSQPQVVIIDEDLGLSGSSTDKRSGFTRMTSEVALAGVYLESSALTGKCSRTGDLGAVGCLTYVFCFPRSSRPSVLANSCWGKVCLDRTIAARGGPFSPWGG
jgi:hypothetical protein